MNLKAADRLIRACREDQSLLNAILDFLDDEQNQRLKRYSSCTDHADFLKNQGGIKAISEISHHLDALIKKGRASDT